ADVLDSVFSTLKDVMDTNGPAVEFFATAIKGVITGIGLFAKAVLSIAGFLGGLASKVLKLFGFKGDSAKNGASSYGAAVRNVSTTTDAESISRKATEQ